MNNAVNQEKIYEEIFDLIKNAREKVKTAINLSMVYTYYEIGKRIFLEEQKGKERANYGEALLKGLANKLTSEFGNGFSEENLKLMRRFYVVYSNDKIGEPLVTELKDYPLSSDGRVFFLSWALYLKLMRIDKIEESK